MLTNAQSKLQLEAAVRYAENITSQALAYLEGRGISEQTARAFNLGVITDPAPGHEAHVGWLSIPYFTVLGLCVGFKFRRLDDGKPKYGSPTGQKAHLYNVGDTQEKGKFIVVCEGELDTIVMSGMCNIPAVGVPGVAAWKPHFAKLLMGFETVFILGDNDLKEDGSNPGAEFSRRVAQEVINSRIVQLPQGSDVNDYYLTSGADGVRELLGLTNV